MKRDFEISLEYKKSDIINKQLVLFFDIKLVNFSEKKITKEEILSEIKKKIPKGEDKFIKIKSYTDKVLILFFDTDSFFNSKSKLVETDNRYVKRLLLNKLPTVILNNVNSIEYTKVIEESFRNYISKNEDLRKKIANSVAENLPLVYYKFKYDGNLNVIRIEVKEQFRHNIIAVLKSKKSPNKKLKKMDFDSSVITYLKLNKRK